MDGPLEDAANDTIRLLEARMRRIEYAITGQNDRIKSELVRSARMRVRDLEEALDRLVKKSKVAQDLLRLHAAHPDFFHTLGAEDVPSSLHLSSRSSIILAAASSFPLTASSLTSIMDTPVPTAKSSTQLIETQARIVQIETLQELQLRDIAALKQRTLAVLQRWYSVDILQIGDCWADVESRVEVVERNIRQATLGGGH